MSSTFIEYLDSASKSLWLSVTKVEHQAWDRLFFIGNVLIQVKTDHFDPAINDFIKGSFLVCFCRDDKVVSQMSYDFELDEYIRVQNIVKNGVILDEEFLRTNLLMIGICACFFMDVAEVFEEVVKPKEKKRLHNCKYQNKGKQDLIFLNANYIKTSIQRNGFPVRGHFRWQKHGKGLSKSKLIFIDSYEKNGYKIEAKKNNIMKTIFSSPLA